jgi:hypothetical protein
MANVYIEPRPKGRPKGSPITNYVAKNYSGDIVKTSKKQEKLVEWAKNEGHDPLIARVRKLNNRKIRGHWRSA